MIIEFGYVVVVAIILGCAWLYGVIKTKRKERVARKRKHLFGDPYRDD
jgi:hypothetical protein